MSLTTRFGGGLPELALGFGFGFVVGRASENFEVDAAATAIFFLGGDTFGSFSSESLDTRTEGLLRLRGMIGFGGGDSSSLNSITRWLLVFFAGWRDEEGVWCTVLEKMVSAVLTVWFAVRVGELGGRQLDATASQE